MKLWVDDLRPPPHPEWVWCTTSREAITALAKAFYSPEGCQIVSLDHDLGGDDSTRAIVLFFCETGWWPDIVLVHTANPVGREWLEGMVSRYKP